MTVEDINKLSKDILDAAYEVYFTLGTGLLEYAYKLALMQELRLRGFDVKPEWPIPYIYKGINIPHVYYADLLVEDEIIIELKSVEKNNDVYTKQLLTYLRLSDKKLGFLINFNSPRLKDGIKRVVNNL